MVVPPKHSKMIIFGRKTNGLLGKPTILGNTQSYLQPQKIEPKMGCSTPAFGHEAATIGTSNLHGTGVPRLIHGHGVSSALLLGAFFPPGGCGAKLQRFFQWFWVVCDLPNLICCNSDFFRPEKFSDSGTFPTKNHTHSSFMEDFLFFKFTCLVPEKSSSKFWGFGGWEGHLFQEKACKKSLRYYPPS